MTGWIVAGLLRVVQAPAWGMAAIDVADSAKSCLANAQVLGSTSLVVVGSARPGRRRPRTIDDDLVGRSSRTPAGGTSPPAGVEPSRIAARIRIPPTHTAFPCPRDLDRVESRRVEQEIFNESDF